MGDGVMEKVRAEPQVSIRDSLDNVRTATQQLHKSISSALARRSQATSADIEALAKKAKESAELARSTMSDRFEAAHEQIKQHLKDAATKLDAAERRASESVKKSGNDLRESLMGALAEARASAKDISEAVAAKRSAIAAKQKETTKA